MRRVLTFSVTVAALASGLVVIALTTYFSLVIGELVPKQVALKIAVPVAIVMARRVGQ